MSNFSLAFDWNEDVQVQPEIALEIEEKLNRAYEEHIFRGGEFSAFRSRAKGFVTEHVSKFSHLFSDIKVFSSGFIYYSSNEDEMGEYRGNADGTEPDSYYYR